MTLTALLSSALVAPVPLVLATDAPRVGWQESPCAEWTEATYYNSALAGEQMANGHPYDPRNPRLASSNRYRLGTLLRVTRADRAASIVVEVVDRGSPALGLDLSEAAFERLAPLREGRIRVCVEPLWMPAGRTEPLPSVRR